MKISLFPSWLLNFQCVVLLEQPRYAGQSQSQAMFVYSAKSVKIEGDPPFEILKIRYSRHRENLEMLV